MKAITKISLITLVIVFLIKINVLAQSSVKITFNVFVNCNTPKGEDVCVYIESLEGVPTGDPTAYKMNKTANNQWQFTISNQWFYVGQTLKYKYCRNLNGGGADESFDNKNLQGYRKVVITNSNISVTDTVNKWRWWPIDGVISDIDTSTYLSTPPANLPHNSFKCGVMLPDWWNETFSPYIKPTFDKIVKNSNSMWLEYSPVPEIKQFYPTPIILREGSNGTPEKDLIKIITEAHNRGLHVYLDPFPWSFVNDTSATYHSDMWWEAFKKEWGDIMLYYAQIAQKYRVEMLGFRMWPNIWNISDKEIPVIDSLSIDLIKQVRSIYSGDICVEFSPWGKDMQIYSKGDYLGFLIWSHWPWPMSNSDNPMVSDMISNLSTNIDNNIANSVSKWGKPIILNQIACPSYVGGAHTSYPEEMTDPFFPDNPKYQIDLQVQANVYEAMLNVFTGKDWIAGSFSFIYGFYWDEIAKDYSIRAKPVEKVVAKWYRWLYPDNRHISISCTEGGSTNPLPASYIKNVDDVISITAIPDSGYEFSNWTGDVNSESNPISISLDTDKEITAVFKKTLTNVNENLISDYNLSQNYPNPFKYSTIINYHIPIDGFVTIKVYDNNGTIITSLVNKNEQKGDYSTIFNARGIANGSYYYTIQINNIFYETKKMIIVK